MRDRETDWWQTLTSSLMIKLGRRPDVSSGGISEPRRLGGPEPGASDPFRSGAGLFSRMTSILGASTVGALISGTFGLVASFRNKQRSVSAFDSGEIIESQRLIEGALVELPNVVQRHQFASFAI